MCTLWGWLLVENNHSPSHFPNALLNAVLSQMQRRKYLTPPTLPPHKISPSSPGWSWTGTVAIRVPQLWVSALFHLFGYTSPTERLMVGNSQASLLSSSLPPLPVQWWAYQQCLSENTVPSERMYVLHSVFCFTGFAQFSGWVWILRALLLAVSFCWYFWFPVATGGFLHSWGFLPSPAGSWHRHWNFSTLLLRPSWGCYRFAQVRICNSCHFSVSSIYCGN